MADAKGGLLASFEFLDSEVDAIHELRKAGFKDLRAYAPYLIIIGIFSIAQIPLIKQKLAESPWTANLEWPGLQAPTTGGNPVRTPTFSFNWLSSAGTLMLIAGLITMVVISLSPVHAPCA